MRVWWCWCCCGVRADVKALLNHATFVFNWPGLHDLVLRMPPIARAAVEVSGASTR